MLIFPRKFVLALVRCGRVLVGDSSADPAFFVVSLRDLIVVTPVNGFYVTDGGVCSSLKISNTLGAECL